MSDANETTFDELELRIAGSAANLLKTLLEFALLRALDGETFAKIKSVQACSLKITAEGPTIQLEMQAQTAQGTFCLFRSTFSEPTVLHTLQ